MLTKEWWLLTYKWLFGQKKAGQEIRRASYLMGASLWVALISGALGVGALSFVRALVTGFETQLALGVSDFFGPLSYKSGWRSEKEHELLAQKISYPVESYWQGQGLLVGPKTGRGVMLEGRRMWGASQHCSSSNEIPLLTIGQNLAESLGVQAGQNLKILLPGLIKGSLNVKVNAIKSFGLQELDARRVILDDLSLHCYLKVSGKMLMERPGDYLGFRFYPKISPNDEVALMGEVAVLQKLIKETLRDAQPQVKTSKEQNRNFFKGLGFDRAVLSVVLGFLTLAACLNVAAALFVIFFERDKDMMTLRALGMSPLQMRRWILIQGFMIGLLGSTLGMIGSGAAALLFEKGKLIKLPPEVYNLDHLVFSFSWPEQLGVFLFGVGSALFISWGVAYLLSRMKIVEVLSHRR
ncbi:MAG: FtsX-like permease family protein [bacterium]